MDDFDPADILIAHDTEGEGIEAFTYTPPLQVSDGSDVTLTANDIMVGHTGSDSLQIDGLNGGQLYTLAGNDSVSGTPGGGHIYTGGGDDTVSITGSDTRVFGGTGGDDNLSGGATTTSDGFISLKGGEDGDDTLTHEEGSEGTALLDGGDGHDTLHGRSGDTLVGGGEDNHIRVDAPLTPPGADHGTDIGMTPGVPPHTDVASTLNLQFPPEGTTGSLHIVNHDNTVYFRGGVQEEGYAEVYFVPDGASFDPDDTSNATKVATMTYETLYAFVQDGYPFPDYADVLTSNVPIGSVTLA